MGLNDRDYGRAGYNDGYGYGGGGYGQQPGLHLGAPKSMTVILVLVNIAVYVLQLINRSDNPQAMSAFDSLFALNEDWYQQPWRIFEFLTYGFLHDTRNLWHLAGNMFVLWMFGRSVEERLGSREFLAFYLTAIVVAGAVWNLCEIFLPGNGVVLGASGGVSGVLLLFIFMFPRVTILFMFVFPMPAWVLGVIIVGSNILGSIGQFGYVAFTAHLGGFLFAWLYYKTGKRLTDYLPTELKMPSFKRKPPLKVHRPSDEQRMQDRLDELLGKVSRNGQDSLTTKERRELEKLSKHYQNKRR